MRKRGRVLSLIVLLSMLMSSFSTVFAQVSDVDKHWAKEEINYMVGKGYLSGYPDGTFKPDANISKAEFYRIINNLFGYEKTSDFGFSDVKEKDWFYSDVAKAIEAGYIFDGELLYPNEFIKREEVARIIGVTFKLKENSSGAIDFKDYDLMSANTVGYIGALKANEYIKGFPDGSFGPKNNISRAEVVKMLYNILIAEGIPQKSDLKAYKEALAAVKESDYTKQSWSIYQKVVLANVVTEDNTQEEVDAATAAIIAAQGKLVKASTGGGGYVPSNPVVADKTELQKAIALANAKVQDDYTQESWEVFSLALEAAKTVNKNASATQNQVNTALTNLNNAMNGLVEKSEEPNPQPAITNIMPNSDVTLSAGDILNVSFNAPEGGYAYFRLFSIANNSMRTNSNNNDSITMTEPSPGHYVGSWTVQSDTTGTFKLELNFEKDTINLQEVPEYKVVIVQENPEEPEDPEVDKEDLIEAIAEAEAKDEDDYTAESWSPFAQALQAAIVVRDNADATQDEVNTALSTLTATMNALVEKDRPTPTITATFQKGAVLTTFGNATVQVQNIEGAAKFSVVYNLADNDDGSENIKETAIVNIGSKTETFFFDPNQHNTITIKIYDANNNLLHTFLNVVPVIQ